MATVKRPDPYLGKTITAFEGGIVTRIIDHPHDSSRVFAYEVTFRLRHPRVLAVAALKPPLHFHPYQEEYIEVLEGRLAVEIEGVEHVLAPKDGELKVRPWCNHRLYSPVTDLLGEAHAEFDDGWDGEKTVFLLSGEDTDEMFRLDTVFFENWYAYQDLVVVKGEKIDLIQVMSMFDAGGSYLSLPSWIPFGRTIARGMGIVVGRWIGGLLGYQPFFQKWTTDWDLACDKMDMSIFHRRFANGGTMASGIRSKYSKLL
ncbi:hypothetical protein F5B22DRAFT_104796 [Xylaria bambusicola]|uniref:uncharacterized protein n=1 Tax=Xylaria bambusicola TaxID=326684 RepID=UPI002007430A|nr:uncharacterized protein F5B22DRAFT_104796 [Xylaria bambusicola]KAI0517437.1 hypothetical protein F5B22DRAFT_104796 [Xylaria bambusicola]